MDTITHITLGACIGEVFFGRQIGKRAMLLGAIANSIPDIDFIAGFWMSPSSNLLAHRGFTHSFLFAILISVLLALIGEKMHRVHKIPLKTWFVFFIVQIFSHLFLDAFNAYGIGWFEPFSHYRVSFNTIFVADPFFSIWIGLAFIILLVFKRNNSKRIRWAKLGLALSSLYLLYAVINKLEIDEQVKKSFAQEHIPYKRYFTSPTPLNNWLWYIVAESDSGFFIGYRSVFDRKKQTYFQYFPRNESLLRPVEDHEDLQRLKRFSKGYYTVELWKETLVFNDLRFGQIAGWQDPQAHFIFHYYLREPANNRLVVQRGRFQNWNWRVLKLMLQRIQGR